MVREYFDRLSTGKWRVRMARLLNEVDRLSDRLHEEFITITEDDYRMFGPELKIVISTLKALRRESQSRPELKVIG